MRRPSRGTGRIWWRLAIMLPVLVVALCWKLGLFAADAAPEPVVMRQATAAEWALPIAELGRRQMGKRVGWLALQISYGPDFAGPRSRPIAAQGELVWWCGERGESLSYLPAPGEGPEVGEQLKLAIVAQRTVRLVDPDLARRLVEMESLPLPPGWTVLTEPPPSRLEADAAAAP